MKVKWWRNNRVRLMLTLELAVMLPAAALIFANYHNLKSIERDKVLDAAIHREFQQMLAISEKQFNLKAYKVAEKVRAAFPSPVTDSGTAKLQKLDRVMAENPDLVHVFVFDPHDGLVFRTRESQLNDVYVTKERERLEKALGNWLPIEAKMLVDALHKKTKPVTWTGEMTKRAGGPTYGLSAIFSLPDLPKGHAALGGITFDPEYLRRKLFPEMLDGLIAYKLREEGGKRLAMNVSFAEDEAGWSPAAAMKNPMLAASTGWSDGKPEVTRNFTDVFKGLALGIKFEGTSVHELGRRWVRQNLIILGVLSLLLVGGLVLTYRSISKEVALAKLKSDFVSNVSHELRTPLSLIRLYAETLELGRITAQPKRNEYYRIIRMESERLTALINNILDFSRIEAGRKEYEFRRTDLAELVGHTLDCYRDQIDEKGFTFEQSIDPNIPPVRVDREAIARSLVNLVNNALKYSAEEKFLAVKLYRAEDLAKLEVIDRGIGIARGEQEKIFEKFYRAGDPLVHNTKGSGLGLSLVRHIAHAHGGAVEVESTPGKGSKFTLTLPLEPGAQPQAAADAEVRIAG